MIASKFTIIVKKPYAIGLVYFIVDIDVFTSSKVFANFTEMFIPGVIVELAVSVLVMLRHFAFNFKSGLKLLKMSI